MKVKLMLVMAAMALFLLGSCVDSKDTYVSNFRNFVEKVQKEGSDYTKAEWEQADNTYKKYADTEYDKYSSKLSAEEKAEVAKLKAAYAAKKGGTAVKNGVEKAVEKGKEALGVDKN